MAKAKRKTAGELPDEVVERIRADLRQWQAGLWAEEVAYGPACRCSVRACGHWSLHGIDDGVCYRHP